jgi:hypothetical protein
MMLHRADRATGFARYPLHCGSGKTVGVNTRHGSVNDFSTGFGLALRLCSFYRLSLVLSLRLCH